MFNPSYVMQNVLFFLVLQSSREMRANCFTLIVFLLYYDCKRFVSLPHDGLGLSARCVYREYKVSVF